MKRTSKKAVMMLFIVFSAILYPLTLKVGASSSDFRVVETFWGSVNNPLEVGPGDRGVPFSVIIQNIGRQAYSGLDALLYLQAPFSNVMGENVAQGYYAGSIPVGQTATLQFQLNIDASASIGSYSMIMSLRYGSGFALGETLTVPILLLGRVELKVSVDPPSLLPGSVNKLMINVSNEGTGYASGVSVTLNFPPGLSTIGGGDNHWYLQSIAPNEIKTIIVDAFAQSSLAGSLSQIGASITYTDAYGTSRAVSRTIGIRVLPIVNVPFTVAVKGSDLLPGTVNTLTLSILNNDTNPVSFVQATLTIPSGLGGILGEDNSWFFPSIDPSESVTFSAKLMVSSSAAGLNYQLTLTLSYLDPFGITRTESHVFGVQVLEIVHIPIAVAVKESSLLPSTVNILTFSMLNNQTKSVSSVEALLTLPTASAGGTPPLIILGQGNRWFFPSIDPFGSITFNVPLMVSSGAAGLNYQLTLTLSYLDPFGITRTESHVFGVQVLPASESVLLVSVAQNVLTSETTNELKIIISNVGKQTVSSLSVALSTPSTIVVSAGDNQWNFESVNPHENVTFTAMLFAPKTAAGNSYQVQLSLSYKDYLGNLHAETRAISLIFRAWTTPIIVSVTKSILTAGSFNEPTIAVANSGKAPVHSITINLSFLAATGAGAAAAGVSPIILPAGNQWYFDLLLPNKNITFSPKIFASLNSMDNSYQAQLSVSYVDEYGISHVETMSLGFSVRGAINLEVFSSQVIPRATVAGGNVTVTGDLMNTGNTRALYTTVTAKPSPIFIPTVEGSIYLGEISPNTLMPFSIFVGVRTTAANGTYPLTLVFTYRDDYGDKYTIEKNFDVIVGGTFAPSPRPTPTLTPTGTPTQVSIFQMIPYIIITIVAVFLVFMVYRRRRRSRR